MDTRITRFLTEAQHLTDSEAIQQLCTRELDTLYGAYTDSYVHTLVTRYRNAIRRANLPPAFLEHMREWQDRSDGLRTHAKQTRKQRQDHQYPIVNEHALIDQAIRLLASASYAAVLQGLALLTGRRAYELAVTGVFTPDAATSMHILFHGQAKTRETDRAHHAYVIPVLADHETIGQAITRLRQMRDFTIYAPGTSHANHLAPSSAFQDRYGKTLREACQRYFGPLLPGIPLNPKALRKIYALIAYDWFAPVNQSLQSYTADILGHSYADLDTSNAYQDFYLAESE